DLGGMGLPLIVTNFDTQLSDAIDSLLRVRSGAAVPPDEVSKFKKRMLGSFSSSPEALKLRMLQMQRQILLEKASREETGFEAMGPNVYLMSMRQLADYVDAHPEDQTATALAKMYIDAAGMK
ncbi:MAG: hypothetical protein KKC77_19245, partial [Proteobacteria bacterium]|nr:hypothetical protein [Pseudomonadota bacterium]